MRSIPDIILPAELEPLAQWDERYQQTQNVAQAWNQLPVQLASKIRKGILRLSYTARAATLEQPWLHLYAEPVHTALNTMASAHHPSCHDVRPSVADWCALVANGCMVNRWPFDVFSPAFQEKCLQRAWFYRESSPDHVHHVGASRPRAWDIWSACVIANGTQMDDSWWRYGHTPGPALIRIALYHPQYLSSPAAQTFAREYAPWLDRLQTASTVDDAMFTDEEPNQEQRAMRKIARLTEIMAPQAGSFDLPSEWTP